MAPSETDGFISWQDMPPWDTWIYSQSGYLLSYVPTLFVDRVNSAVQCVSDGCLVWAEDIKDCLSFDSYWDQVFFKTLCAAGVVSKPE